MKDIVLECAFRYALGRRTYITGVISKEIISQWAEIPRDMQLRIQRDILSAVESNLSGDNCDTVEWMKVATQKIKKVQHR